MGKILLLVHHRENKLLLEKWLGRSYDLICPDGIRLPEETFDLGIIDGQALDRLWNEIQDRRDIESPTFLPFLLITNRKDVKLLTRHLWRTIDEILLTPIEKVELQARVEILLRTRRLSVEAEKRYHALTDSSQAGVFILQDECIVYANSALLKMSGREWNEVAGRNFLEYVHPEDRERVIKRYQDLIAGEQTESHEVRILTPSGARWLELCSAKTMYKGKPGILGVALDVTERKTMELERERLVAAVEQSGEMIVITNPDGIIQYVNPAFEKVTGYTRQEVIGKTPKILKSGKQDREFYRNLWETILAGQTWKGRMVNKRKDGTFFAKESTISPVKDPSGRIINFVAVKRDITEYIRMSEEQELLKEQFQQAQKLEAVGRLAGGVAHDFNNMLNVILGYGEMILNRLHEEDPLREEITEIVQAAKRSADLTRQLLAFSRKQPLAPEVLDLNTVVRNIEKMLTRLIGEDVELELILAEGIGHVMADPGQLEQVIMNLAVNAKDAMPRGGKLIIETANVELDETYASRHVGVNPGSYVMLSVTDTGCGMAAETLSHIFEPFFSTKEKGKGTGLGLSTVYGIVKQSGGHIWVYSELGRGTTFKIYLPRTETKDQLQEVAIQKVPTKGEGEYILVVEDEESLRNLVHKALSSLGYRVSVAANGREALLMIEEKVIKPDLLITDVVMPDMGGRELVERARRDHPNMKVLFMSGYTDEAVVHHAILDRGTPFLQKPFDLSTLAETVRNVLTGRQ